LRITRQQRRVWIETRSPRWMCRHLKHHPAATPGVD